MAAIVKRAAAAVCCCCRRVSARHTTARVSGSVNAACVLVGAAEQDVDGAPEELVLKPLRESFTKPIDEALLLTCEVTNAVDERNYNIKWFGDDGREIVDRSGRSVSSRSHLTPPVVTVSAPNSALTVRGQCPVTASLVVPHAAILSASLSVVLS